MLLAVQYWDHSTYEANKCHGPFVAEWGCCCAPWHPSILGHEIRSAHYSFFWLMIYQDSIRAILTGISTEEVPFVSNITTGHTLVELKDKLFKHYHHARRFPAKAIFPSNIPENVQCLTSYEPIMDQTSNLANWVIDNKGPNTKYFVREIFENLHRTEIIVHARASGYKDFKYGFYGNNDSKPLSIKIDVKSLGTTQICVPPPVGNFDQDLAIHPFWKFNAKIYLRTGVADWEKLSPFKEDINGTFIRDPNGIIFDHQVEHSKLLTYNNESDVNQVCLALKDHLPVGRHVLSIVATTADNIFISTLLIP